MRPWTILVIVLFTCQLAYAQSAGDPLIHQLDSVISKRQSYTDKKNERINLYKSRMAQLKGDARFDLVKDIYNEYKSFVYDSAAVYAAKLQELAYRLNDPVKIADSKIKLAFILTSSGLLNEALDTLHTVHVQGLPDKIRVQYFYLMVRTCYDLADFSQNRYYGSRYEQMAKVYVDSASTLMSPASVEYQLMSGLLDLRQRNLTAAEACYEKLVFRHELDDQQFAIAASTLSYIYSLEGKTGKSKDMLVKAVIADIKASTKEAVALVKLAELLYKEGNIEKASQYIKLAMEDANFYGARYRKHQLSALFPLIEGERLLREEAKRKMLLIYSVLITGSVIVFIGVLYVIKKKNNKLEKAQEAIQRANYKLEESNKIKEEYVTYYFNTTAEYISRLEGLKKSMEMKLHTKKMEELRFVVDSINIKREREGLYHGFDKFFLALFPDFVTVFQSLFKEEDRVHLKEGQLLNTELRIFALIRLGIHDTEKIASILDYSVGTIYTYKARIRSKSIAPNDEFDKRIMAIRTI
jgi:DNA-binding CsgD family transcriptional regulator/tetratricopeptide (TPR) repeat protein